MHGNNNDNNNNDNKVLVALATVLLLAPIVSLTWRAYSADTKLTAPPAAEEQNTIYVLVT